MTIDSPFSFKHLTHYTAFGWLVSCILHGSLTLGTILFLERMQLAPQQEPFKWNVAMVAPAPEADSQGAATAPTPPLTSATQVERSPTKASRENAQSPPFPPATTATAPRASVLPPATEPHPRPTPARPDTIHEPVQNADRTVKGTENVEPPASLPRIHEPTSTAPRLTSPKLQPPFVDTPTIPPPEATDSIPAKSELGDTPSSEARPKTAMIPPTGQPNLAKPDYGWLSELMAKWIENLDKRYPAALRTEGIQGKVTLSAVLHQDGTLSGVRVAKSSGNAMLDEVALEDVRNGPPITFSRPLERPQIPVKFSIIYDLKTGQ